LVIKGENLKIRGGRLSRAGELKLAHSQGFRGDNKGGMKKRRQSKKAGGRMEGQLSDKGRFGSLYKANKRGGEISE